MKKIALLIIILFTCPLIASVNCLSNTKNLQEDFDDKEWHSVACDCPCKTIKGGYCIECCHLQNADTYTVVIPTKIALQGGKSTYPSYDPKVALRKLAFEYLQSKK
ncbi:MAG TPA: hypothetical protein VJJ26_02390 [Candidatus Babeliales bacterium]|nr:hypothetical protein [Candidatus Babeliales bacterium]